MTPVPVTLLPGQEAGINLALTAVSRGDRNAGWAKATPNGNLTMMPTFC